MLRVKLLEAGAGCRLWRIPARTLVMTCLRWKAIALAPRATVKVRTGIAVEARHPRIGRAAGTAGARPLVDGGARDWRQPAA